MGLVKNGILLSDPIEDFVAQHTIGESDANATMELYHKNDMAEDLRIEDAEIGLPSVDNVSDNGETLVHNETGFNEASVFSADKYPNLNVEEHAVSLHLEDVDEDVGDEHAVSLHLQDVDEDVGDEHAVSLYLQDIESDDDYPVNATHEPPVASKATAGSSTETVRNFI